MMIKLKDKSTTLAFVSLKEDGDRDFKFMRNADSDLTFDEIKNILINSIYSILVVQQHFLKEN